MSLGPPNAPTLAQWNFNVFDILDKFLRMQPDLLDLLSRQPALHGAKEMNGLSEVEFTGIPDWVSKITLMINQGSTSTNGNIKIQIGDSSGYATTGYVGVAGSEPNTTDGFFVLPSASAGADRTLVATAVIIKYEDTTWHYYGQCSAITSISTTISSNGTKELTGILDRVKLLIQGGATFDAGTVQVRYE